MRSAGATQDSQSSRPGGLCMQAHAHAPSGLNVPWRNPPRGLSNLTTRPASPAPHTVQVILMDHLDWLDDKATKEVAAALAKQVRQEGRDRRAAGHVLVWATD